MLMGLIDATKSEWLDFVNFDIFRSFFANKNRHVMKFILYSSIFHLPKNCSQKIPHLHSKVL